uniref:Uncharacterized protein n=1 Tax=Setaria viridis TaxID=4556 RepID=A0A4U6T6A9_SETVI|nr:hypothetical protein SEVIR_9G485000v2 [Setaria viridis]
MKGAKAWAAARSGGAPAAAVLLVDTTVQKRGSPGSARIRLKRMECSAVAAIGRRLHWSAKRSFGDRVFGHWALETELVQVRFCRREGLVRASAGLVASSGGLGAAARLACGRKKGRGTAGEGTAGEVAIGQRRHWAEEVKLRVVSGGGRSGGRPRGLGKWAEARDVVGVAASPADGRSAVGGAEPHTNVGLLKDKSQSSCTRVETTQVDRYKRMSSRIVGGGAKQDNNEEIDGENDGGYGDNDYGDDHDGDYFVTMTCNPY